jgi:hypothetical protein
MPLILSLNFAHAQQQQQQPAMRMMTRIVVPMPPAAAPLLIRVRPGVDTTWYLSLRSNLERETIKTQETILPDFQWDGYL